MAYEDRALNARQAAEFLGAHVETIRRLARKNKIPAYKVGRDWRFNKDALRRWAQSHHERVRSASILVVDDERLIQDLMRRIFEGEGYRVSTASDGAEALEFMRRETPDLMLLDLKMPGMDGPTTLREVRKAYGALPVIIITGYADSDLMTEILPYSPVLMLAKPVGTEQLLEAVRLVLSGSRSSAT